MKIEISKDTIVVLAGLATVLAGLVTALAFLYALFGEIGTISADIRHLERRMDVMQEDNREFRRHLQEDNREIRRLITSHLVFHSAGSQVAVATGVGGEVPGAESAE